MVEASPMNYSIFHIAHLISVFFLVACIVYAVATVSERKKLLMYSGIASLIVFISGFGLLGILKAGMPVWAIVKVVIWLALSALVGLAYRVTNGKKLLVLTGILVFLAILMVSLKPF